MEEPGEGVDLQAFLPGKMVDLAFGEAGVFDGDQSYEGVKADWKAFSPHVAPFGVVVFHDTIWEVGEVDENYRRENMGVPRFVEELRREGYQLITIPEDYGVMLVQPVKTGNPLQ